MAIEVRLPQLGQTMEEGTIVSCKVNVGEEVKKGTIIFEIETDKATLEMESPAAGFVKNIVAAQGQTLPVGGVVMILGAKDEKIGDVAPKAAPAASAPMSPAKEAAPAVQVSLASANVVKLPQLGQTMEEGTIVSCKVKPGDDVKKGTIIFEIETDKATLEMESPASGFVKNILVQQGQTVPVGEPVMILAGKDDQVPQSFIDSLKGGAAAPAPAVSQAAPVAQPVSQQAAPAAAEPAGRAIASPRAKKLAEQLGVNLASVKGTGPGGRITEDDVQNASSAKPAKTAATAPAAAKPAGPTVKLGQTVPLNRLQKITGQKMLQSKKEIPCFYLSVKADMTKLVEYRTKFNETSPVKVAYNDFIIRAVAMGIENFAIMAGQLDGETIKLANSVGIGLAISVPDGLVAPIIKDVQKKNVTQIAKDSQTLIEKARNNKLAPDDLSGGCITVSNLGAFGIDSFIPIVVPGQCSILGVGQISDTCVPNNGGIAIRKLMSMTLSVDHKVANGAYAAQFLDFVRKTLEDPTKFA
jgi:pyruvate dehydrogenase E2 component (dihydrolipoamide acetyltransferase)